MDGQASSMARWSWEMDSFNLNNCASASRVSQLITFFFFLVCRLFVVFMNIWCIFTLDCVCLKTMKHFFYDDRGKLTCSHRPEPATQWVSRASREWKIMLQNVHRSLFLCSFDARRWRRHPKWLAQFSHFTHCSSFFGFSSLGSRCRDSTSKTTRRKKKRNIQCSSWNRYKDKRA